MKTVKIPNDSVYSNWKCPDCGEKSIGHTFKWHQDNGTPTCECGSDMVLRSVYLIKQDEKTTVAIGTVNVIEFGGGDPTDIIGVRSFVESPSGNKAAEDLFRRCVIENGGKEEDVDSYIEDGCYQDCGYTIVITHST